MLNNWHIVLYQELYSDIRIYNLFIQSSDTDTRQIAKNSTDWKSQEIRLAKRQHCQTLRNSSLVKEDELSEADKHL